MRYIDVCAGISAASVAWKPLGWTPVLYSEIEKFPRAVLRHRQRARDARHGVRDGRVPLWGDFTTIRPHHLRRLGIEPDTDVLVGGTPCQSFSVAGLRGGMDDPRGGLALAFLQLARRTRTRWVVWENVPGVLSSNGGRDFGAFLGGLAELGYGVAYRILDAQHAGVPQRRRRVFVVGYLGDWRRAAAVLFERHSLSGHSPPRREAGERTAGCAGGGVAFGGNNTRGPIEVATALNACGSASGRMDFESETFIAGTYQNTGHGWCNESDVAQTLRTPGGGGSMEANVIAHTLRADGFDASEDGTGRETPLVPVLPFDTTQVTSKANHSSPKWGDPMHPLAAGAHAPAVAFQPKASVTQSMNPGPVCPTLGTTKEPAVAFQDSQSDTRTGETFATLDANYGPRRRSGVLAPNMAVRRITPIEAERLQGFPDNYTLVPYRGKPAADGPRYKALGNSMAVPGHALDRGADCAGWRHWNQ